VLLGRLLVASACGGSNAHSSGALTAPAGAQARPAFERASIAVASSARLSSGEIAARNTCTGGNVSPPVRWAGLAAGTKEIVVLVRSLSHSHGAINWAVAGIGPSVESIAEGKLPAGAIVGRNSYGHNGYSLCPGSSPALVTIDVLAYPRTLGLHPGFSAGTLNSVGLQWGTLLGHIGPVG
jgi:phosphatidylethanolamine-binding protein (PEBP) family uncharacterized protein